MTIKLLQNINERYRLKIDPNDTIIQIKQKIENELNLGIAESFKFFYLGSILENDQTPESVNMKPNDFIVVMIKSALDWK